MKTFLYRIVVPSTANESAPITPFEHSERVKETFIFLSKLNGGATAVNNCFGGWVNDNGQIVGENVVIVESYGDDSVKNEVICFCAEMRVKWSQNCVGLQILPAQMLFV